MDILVNNAGFGEMGAFLDCDWQRQQNLINLNITALARMSYLYGNDMRKRGSGRIINLSSVAAFSAADPQKSSRRHGSRDEPGKRINKGEKTNG